MTWWSLAVVVLGCDASRPEPLGTRAEREQPVGVKQDASVDAAIAKQVAPFEVVLEEVAVDHPIYPQPKPGTRIRRDARTIRVGVERAVQGELGRIAACVNEPKSAAIGVWFTINEMGGARDVGAAASLTSPGQDPARDKCIAKVIRGIAFSPPGRVASIELALWVRTDD